MTGSTKDNLFVKTISKIGKDRYLAYLFMLPAALLLLSFTLYPILYAFRLSLYEWFLGSDLRTYVGLRNFLDLLSDPLFLISLRNSLIFTGSTVSLQFILGLAIALLLCKDFCGAKFVRGIMLLPMMVAPIVAGFMFKIMYHGDYGIMNRLLQLAGISEGILWLGDYRFALLSVIIADVWQWTPFVVLILMAGIQSLPLEPFEAAIVDGASRWQIFRYITLPMLKKVMSIALVIRIIISLREFDKVWILTQGGPGSSSYVINLLGYQAGLRYFQMGYSSAIVVAIVTLTVVLVGSLMKFQSIISE